MHRSHFVHHEPFCTTFHLPNTDPGFLIDKRKIDLTGLVRPILRGLSLTDLLLQIVKLRCGEKLAQGDAQAVAQFLDGGHRGAVIPSARDIVHC